MRICVDERRFPSRPLIYTFDLHSPHEDIEALRLRGYAGKNRIHDNACELHFQKLRRRRAEMKAPSNIVAGAALAHLRW